ncbi:MAG: hypothetical protein ACJ781_04315 [Myxococcales bacterium]
MRQRAVSIACCIGVALAFASSTVLRCSNRGCSSVLDRPSETDDTRQFLMMWEVSRVSLRDFGELPSWNPYHCGGVVHYLDPQVPFPGPLFFLLFAFVPAVVAIKLWNFLHVVAGALGARALARDSGADPPSQVVAAVLMIAGGGVAEHLGGGQLWYTPFLLLPWALWAHRRALHDRRYAVLCAAIFALAVLEGGVYPVPLGLCAIAFDSLLRIGSPAERRGLARSLPIFAVLFPLLAAVKLVPVLAFLRRTPRLVPLDDGMDLAEVLAAFTTRQHPRAFPPHVYVWPEYDAYVGILALLLAAFGAALALSRRDRRIDLAVLLLLLWCALGDVPGLSLFRLLHELPIYRSLRVPSRFFYPATIFLALLAATALTAIGRARSSFARAAQIAIVAFVAIDVISANAPRLQQGAGLPVPLASPSRDFHQEARVDYRLLPLFPQRGIGTAACYGGFDWPVSRALWFGRVAQQRVEPVTAGSAELLRWSPSELRLRISLEAPARLIVNQNFDPGWQASRGTVLAVAGLLAVDLDPGEHELILKHRPEGFVLGLALTALGVVLSVIFATVRGAPPRRAEPPSSAARS